METRVPYMLGWRCLRLPRGSRPLAMQVCNSDDRPVLETSFGNCQNHSRKMMAINNRCVVLTLCLALLEVLYVQPSNNPMKSILLLSPLYGRCG